MDRSKGRKNILSKVVLVLFLIIGCLVITFSSLTSVYAHQTLDNGLTAGTYAELRQRMSSDTFTHEGQTFNINQYFDNLFANQGRSPGNLRVTAHQGRIPILGDIDPVVFRETDPITSFIPESVFSELTNNGIFTFMGHEWGVIIEVSVGLNLRSFWVQVIDVTGINNLSLVQYQSYSLEISPLFEVRLAWVEQPNGVFNSLHGKDFQRTGPVGVYAFPELYLLDLSIPPIVSIHLRHSFPMSRRNHIVNFAFTGVMANEQALNPADVGFSHLDDFGHYYTATDLFFSGVDASDLVTPRVREGQHDFLSYFRTFGGVASIFDPTGISGLVFTAWDVIDFAMDLVPTSYVLPPVHHFNSHNPSYQNFWQARGQQLQHHQQLIKDASMMPQDNIALSLHGGVETYARGEFTIAQENDKNGNWWISRKAVVFSFDVRSYQSGQIVGNARGSRLETLGVEMMFFTFLGDDRVSARHRVNFPLSFNQIIVPESVFLNGRKYIVSEIARNGFSHVGHLTKIYLPMSITRIGDNAFHSNTVVSWADTFESFNIIPSAFGFQTTYFFGVRTTSHNINGLNVNVRRQRTAYNPIEDLMVLSSNREGACPNYGAFFEFRTPNQSFNRLEIELGLWSGNEFNGSQGIEIYLWYLDDSNVWRKHTNLHQLNLPLRANIATFAFNFRYDVQGFRLSVRVANPQGTENRGRLVVGNMNIQTAVIPPTASDLITSNIGTSNIAIIGVHRNLIGSFELPNNFTVGSSVRTLTQIGASAFENQSQLTEVIVPGTVTNIGNNAFHTNTTVLWENNFIFRNNEFRRYLGTATSFTIPQQVAGRTIANIGNRAFANNERLSALTIPSSISQIGDNAFENMTNLRRITNITNTPQQINSSTFAGLDRTQITVNIRRGTYQAFRSAGWTGFNLVESGISFPGVLSNHIFVGQIYELFVSSTNSADPIVGDVIWNVSGLSSDQYNQITNTTLWITPTAPATFTVSATYSGMTISVTFSVSHSMCRCDCDLNPQPCICMNDFCRCKPWWFLVLSVEYSQCDGCC